MVYLERSETLSFDQERIADAQILKGNVRFRHDDALMFCDSAYFYETTNSLDAFGHVRLEQGDTLQGFCDRLYYNGNTKMARMRRRVRLVHGRADENPTVLTTDSLNYEQKLLQQKSQSRRILKDMARMRMWPVVEGMWQRLPVTNWKLSLAILSLLR